MRIQAISAFNTQKNILSTNAKTSSNIQNNIKNYELPSYDISFGASKAKIHRGYSTLDSETKSEIEETVASITKDMLVNNNTERQYDRIDALIKKFDGDTDALKYIFASSNIKDTRKGASFVIAYLSALDANKDRQDWKTGKWNKFLTELLCDTKNRTGKTIPQIFATNVSMLNQIFEATDNHPDILYAMLTNTDSEGITLASRAAYDTNSRVLGLINQKIYYVAGEDRSIEPKKAIHLLRKNEKALDKDNKRLLEAFLNKEYRKEFGNF